MATGLLGAVAAVSFAVQFFAFNSTFIALKTETVSSFFILASLTCLIRNLSLSLIRVSASGVLLGMAVLTKQTHLLLLPAFLAWLFVLNHHEQLARRRTLVAALCLGFVTPLAMTTAYFAVRGHLDGFLASSILYPAVYGHEVNHAVGYRLARRFGVLLQEIAHTPTLPVLFALSFWQPAQVSGADQMSIHGLRLLQWVTVALTVSVLMAPAVYHYHLVPIRVLMSAVAGVVVAEYIRRFSASSMRDLDSFNMALVVAALMITAAAMFGRGGRGSYQPNETESFKVNSGGQKFGYVLGMWPQFYFANHLVPASDVMFPWAVRGTPENSYFTLPAKGTWLARRLEAARERGVRELINDLGQTPPAYVALISDMARAPDSQHLTDVPELAAYLDANCRLLKRHDLSPTRFAQIFDCTGPDMEKAAAH